MYPALAAVQSLNQQCAEAGVKPEILWIGSWGGMEEGLVKRADLKIELISAAGLRGKNPVAMLRGLGALGRGYRQSRQLIQSFQPDVLFVTGGYVCVPVTLAARHAGVPVIIYLPDIEPGLAIKFLARFADRVAITTDETRRFFKSGLTVVTGYPVRPDLQGGPPDDLRKQEARRQLGWDENLPTLLVFGGSQGARSINQAVVEEIEAYLAVGQVIHVSGKLDIDWVQARQTGLPAELQARYHVSAYLHEAMVTALLAADLVISRAGAAVLGEYPALGLPAILVPLPIAGGHQRQNAEYLARRGAAVTVDNADLKSDLKTTTLNLLTNREKLRTMSDASKTLAKPDAAFRLAQEILEVKSYGH